MIIVRLIDADALMELLKTWQYEAQRLGAEINNRFATAIIAQVNAMPTIEPERKGKWIKVDHGYSYWYECSECGCEPLRSKWNGREVFSDFCPNCGADMKEGAEQE